MTARNVMVVTKPRLMRGFDYRSADGNGIALLLCLGFDTNRSYRQALGRVGRFGDPCKRFSLFDQEMVDKNQQNELDSKLMSGR